MVVKKEKTSIGTWIVVALVIGLSVASGAYNQYQRDQVKQEVDAKYRQQEI